MYAKELTLSISPPEDGRMACKLVLCGETVDFSMSTAHGNDITELLYMLWSCVPEAYRLDSGHLWENCDGSFSLEQDGAAVTLTAHAVGKEGVHLSLSTVSRRDHSEARTHEEDISYFYFVAVIMCAVNDMLNECGLVKYNRNMGKPFPLTEYLVLKESLTGDTRSWFDDELRILRTPFNIPRIRGVSRKFTLVTDVLSYGLPPEDPEITKQRLTVTETGKVYIRKYEFSGKVAESKVMCIDDEDANDIIDYLEGYFRFYDDEIYLTDGGSWRVCFTNENEEEFKFSGSLTYNHESDLSRMSRNVRRCLGRYDLFLFDGNAHAEGDGIKFCSCEFEEGGKTYYYVTDDPSIEEDDYVIVPVGEHGRTATVRVVCVEFFDEDNVPMPLESVKRIIERAEV